MNAETNKQIFVSCAIIEREDGAIMAVRRSASMSMPLKWEFPGGKLDSGESAEACLRRELIEELGIMLHIKCSLDASIYHYPSLTVTLYPFVCSISFGEPVLYEHDAICWKKPELLRELEWSAADIPVVEQFLALRSADKKQEFHYNL